MAADYYETHLDYIKEARELTLNKYQFFPWIKHLLNQSQIDFSKKELVDIPANRPPKRSLWRRLKRVLFE